MTKQDLDKQETQEWLFSLRSVIEHDGIARAEFLMAELTALLGEQGGQAGTTVSTPYMNTIPASAQPAYPGDLSLEAQLEALVRWNAAVLVAKANKDDPSLGGHIGTYASICTMYEVGFNHFFKAPSDTEAGDCILFQGHSTPGIYARAFLEGRISADQMKHFRRESDGKGISSYPHPWLMPTFWQFPTVSMGLGMMSAIYQARFMKYLEARGFAKTSHRKVWAFCGDGEMDEPESMGAITRAGRLKLDNLIVVVNCNLQRLDGLVNGNGKIIQELESSFIGAGWRVIKAIWGSNWEPLFAKDTEGVLQYHLEQVCDGDFQTYAARGGAYMRQHFFGRDPAMLKMVEEYSDTDLQNLLRAGHDPRKVYAAFDAAVKTTGQPVLVLVKSIKGYGLGDAGESRNVAHNAKKLTTDDLKAMQQRFQIPATDKHVEDYELLLPKASEPVMQYMKQRRTALGGSIPQRRVNKQTFDVPHYKDFAARLLEGTGPEREMSSTTAYVQILGALCKDKSLGKHVVPITPDESRTFGMEGLFRTLGIYEPEGQKYEPEDRQQVMYYKESKDGQILQEGINEGGAFCSWMAAATSYSVHQVPMIPFYIYYSMFGFQRIGDYAWMAGDMRARGFLLGATAGRTTINGEGLQHQDGHSLIMSSLIPNCLSYDPTYAYELAVIIWQGLKDMLVDQKDQFYYITMMNENYPHPAMPKDCEQGIIAGMYLLKSSDKPNHASKTATKKNLHVQLLGSGSILREAEAAAELLEKDFGVTSDIWSVTSVDQLYREALDVDRSNRLHPDAKPKVAYITQQMNETQGPIVIATDYVRLHTEKLRQFMPRTYETLGTDGYGRSDTREALRRHFEVDRYSIAMTALYALASDGHVKESVVKEAMKQYKIDSKKMNPLWA